MLCRDIELRDKADRNRAGLFYPCVPLQSRTDTSSRAPQACEEGLPCIVSSSNYKRVLCLSKGFSSPDLMCTSQYHPVSTGDCSSSPNHLMLGATAWHPGSAVSSHFPPQRAHRHPEAVAVWLSLLCLGDSWQGSNLQTCQSCLFSCL